MYHDKETGLTFASRQSADKVKFWTRVKQGGLCPIRGFSRYVMNEDGMIFNVDRAALMRVHSLPPDGRLIVSLVSDSGSRKTVSVARLVATQFLGDPPSDQYHDAAPKDGNITNVHPSNLEWVPRWKRHANPANYNS